MPQIQRVGMRVNGVGMLRREGEPVPPSDPDTVYYTKTSLPHVFDVSIAGPFWPIEAMGEHIHSRCSREGACQLCVDCMRSSRALAWLVYSTSLLLYQAESI
jgi:hypothetical protein